MIPGVGRRSQRQRDKAIDQAPPGALRDFLTVPAPPSDTGLERLPLLAVDVETTGLDSSTDRVVAVGWVPVDGAAIDLSRAQRHIVATRRDVGQSATVHGLTDDEVSAGTIPIVALQALLAALAGRVLLAHHAPIEVGFLAAACHRVYGVSMVAPSVDTLVLQRRVLTEGIGLPADPPHGSLRLWAARARYGLPHYGAHDPLSDALACAELYLAQTAELSLRARRPLTLKALQRG